MPGLKNRQAERTKRQAGNVERTAANPVEVPSVERRAEEFTARRRGKLRHYFRNHPRVMDVVVVFSYLLLGAGSLVSTAVRMDPTGSIILALSCATVLMFRRDRPLAVLGVLSLFELISIILDPGAGNLGLSLWFSLYAVAVQYRALLSFAATALASMPITVYMFLLYDYPDEFLIDDGPTAMVSTAIAAVVIVLANVIATGIGASVRRSRLHEAELAQWAVRNAQLASVAERNRIAREMHDVVAHSLTVMVALSDGAAVVVKRDPAKAGDVLGQLSQTGRTALADMRRVLGVLREEPSSLRAPQPDHADMGGLIEGFRQAGLPITFTQSGPAIPAEPALALTVYRIVQESLTNVLRYGSVISRVEVVVENLPEQNEIRVLVTNDGSDVQKASVGTGRGIVGMRERARIYAGTVDAGPAPQGGWRVSAILHPGEGAP